MKELSKMKNYLLILAIALVAFGCDNEDDGIRSMANDETSMNIVETADETEALKSLVQALGKADENEGTDLVSTLSGDGPFTVFAPTNTAFDELLASLDGFDSLDDFDTEEEKALLAEILTYHVVAGAAVPSGDLIEGQQIETVQGENVSVSLEGGVFIGDATMEDAEVVIPNVTATNGIVHVIDKVLLPQSILDALAGPQDLVDIVIATETLSALEAAVIKADLVETLKGNGPFTVFAPTDDAFMGLLMALGGDYNSIDDFDTDEEIALLRDILLYHVVPAKVLETDLAAGTVATALAENSIEVIESDGTFVIGDASDTNANILDTDIEATNGVAHVIDKVLLPQAAIDFVASLEMKNIVEIAVETDDLSLLVEALTTANSGPVETLGGDGPFTVFAPTNDAFVALLEVFGDDYNSLADFDTQEEIDLLVNILTYHVVAGTEAFSTDLADGQTIPTVNGADVAISLDGGVFIQDATDMGAQVVIPDVDASNGVVHVINKVLLPQEAVDFVTTLNMKNIIEIAVETDDLSLLVEALTTANAGLVETLSGDGPFTVFAPTNDAFVALLEVLGDDYNSLADFDTQEEIDLLVSILTYHVVAGTEAFSTDLSDGQSIPTVNGANVGINIKDGTVHVVDATDMNAAVVIPDVDASNGVVHVINKVLLPQEAVDFVTMLNMKNIVEIAVETDDLSLLVEALTAANAGLVETLSGEGPFTVFAPTNDAFVALLEVLGDDYNSLADFDTQEEIDLLVSILTYHVVAGTEAFSTDLSDGQHIPTVNGGNVGINIKDGTVHVVDATDMNAVVVIPDVDASNGVVHVINKVLLPQEAVDFVTMLNMKNIVEIAVETDDLSLLVEALTAANAGLVETLSGEGPFTVFAPTNDAFVALLEVLGDDYNSLADFDTQEEIDLLVSILTYHVVAGTEAFSTDLSDGQHIPTVNGGNVGINIKDGTVHVVDATDMNAAVVIPDVDASNGVVHVINKVLLPQEAVDFVNDLQTPDIVDLALSVDDLSLLVEALIQADAGLVEALQGDGPFTVFAPTNQAFANLLHALGNNFNSLADFDTPEEKVLLAKLLTYHVVAGDALASGDLSNHQVLETLQGETITIRLNHGVFISDKTHVDAQVTDADNEAKNGIVHIIDKVLLPQEIIDALH